MKTIVKKISYNNWTVVWLIKKQKNMEKIVIALSSALTACLLLLRCYVTITLYRVGSSIVEKQRHWSIQQNEIQVSYEFVSW